MSGSQTIATSDIKLGGLRIQNTGYGVAISILYGTNRLSPNLIDYTNFIATAHTSTTSAGGKGGGVNQSSTTYTYTAAVIMAMCEGPVASFGALWLDKDTYTDPSKRSLSLFNGTYPQSPWAWMSTYAPARSLGYQGIAYAACASYELGNGATLGNHSFEVAGLGTLRNGFDVNVVDVIADFLGNVNYGALFPYLGATTDAWNYCQANGIFISPALIAQKPAHEWLTQFARIANIGLVWSAGLLKLVPYGDTTISGNGATYTPNITPLYDLTDDDFIANGGDPISVSRKRQADAFNAVQVEYINRGNQYAIEPVDVKDQANIEAYGLRTMSPVQLHEICVPAIAKQVAQAFLQRELYIRNEYSFSLAWKYCLLEPMDIVSLTDAALGLYQTPVRIISIEESYDGLLAVTAEEMPYGVSQPAKYPHTGGIGYQPNYNIAPGLVNTPAIFELPNALTAPNLEVCFAVSGGVDWGGCDVWVSEDNATYRNIGKINNPARHGVLSASLAVGADPDTAHTLAVDLSACRGQLISGTQADADNLNTMMWLDGEIIAYQSATLTAPYQYNLSYLRRGAKGTASGAHTIGAKFARLDDAIFHYIVPRAMVGSPVWVKFASFNAFGAATQSLAECTAYNYTIQGNRPAGLSVLYASGGMFLNNLSWTFAANQYDRDYTEILGSTSNDRNTALTLTSAKNPTAAWKHPGLTPAQTWYYWGRTVDTSGNTSDWYPLSATGGVAAAPSADPSALLTQLQNSVGLGQLASELASPIAQVIDPINMVAPAKTAVAILNLLLKADELKKRAQLEKWVTDATSTIDPATGKVTLLATATLSTDVQAHLNQVDLTLGAIDGSIISHTATLSSYGTRLSADETSITQMQGDITLKASSSYVDGSIATVLGAIDPANITANQNLNAQTLLQTLLDGNASRSLAQMQSARVSVAEQTLRATSDAVSSNAIERTILAAVVEGNVAAIQTEQTARATADSANAGAISTLSAQVNNATTGLPAATAAIQTEQTTRATADSANAGAISTVQARLDTGDYAAVKTQSSANANALGTIEAKYAVKVDVNGHVTGFELIQNGTVGSFVILADKFLIAKPDGSGTPKQVLILGTVNGVSALGLDGNLIVDGSIVAQALAANSVTASKIAAGSITADRLAAKTITALSGVIGDLAVDTLQVAGNAITIPVSSYAAASVTLSGTEQNCGSATINSSGAPINIRISFRYYIHVAAISSGGGGYGASITLQARILRSDGMGFNSGMISAASAVAGANANARGACSLEITDIPGAGVYTYSAALYLTTTGQVVGYDGTASNINVNLLETKR